MMEVGPCVHRAPSPGQSMCSCEHRRIELELLVGALAQEVTVLQNRLDRHAAVLIHREDLQHLLDTEGDAHL